MKVLGFLAHLRSHSWDSLGPTDHWIRVLWYQICKSTLTSCVPGEPSEISVGNGDVLRSDVSSPLKLPGMRNTAPNRGLSPEFSLIQRLRAHLKHRKRLITDVSCDMTKRSEGRDVWEKPFISLFRVFMAFV